MFSGEVVLDQPNPAVRRYVEFYAHNTHQHDADFERLDLEARDGVFSAEFALRASGYPRCNEAGTADVAVYPFEVRVEAPGCETEQVTVGPDWEYQKIELDCE